MKENSQNIALKELGFSNKDKVVIFHADDVGMFHSTVDAYIDLVEFGLLSSASVMTTCPWFPAIAKYSRDNSLPSIDLGVHLTLTSEWENYRWKPISTGDSMLELIDNDGYFKPELCLNYSKNIGTSIDREFKLQIELAVSLGIDITHIDTHMLTAWHPSFLESYIKLGQTYNLPTLLVKNDLFNFFRNIDSSIVRQSFEAQQHIEESKYFPLIDNFYHMPLDNPEDRVEQIENILKSLPNGITHFTIHPAKDSAELRAVADDWPSRVADYEAFLSKRLKRFVKESGIHVIGYRTLLNLLSGNN